MTTINLKYLSDLGIHEPMDLQCPMCPKKYRLVVPFVKHMDREHDWTAKASLKWISQSMAKGEKHG